MRFTSPHPRDFTDDVIAAMAETPNVMPSLHMPLQSGSDAVLKRMRRSYRRDKYLGILDRVRAAMPGRGDHHRHHRRLPRRDRATTSPQTLDVVRRGAVRRARSPSSTRHGPARRPPAMDGQVPKPVVQERYERLVALQDEVSWAENRAQVGRRLELLVAEGEGRKDGATSPAAAAGRATTGWCTSRPGRDTRRRGRATWSRSR